MFVQQQFSMSCLLFTLTKSDQSSEHQPRPLRVQRTPRPQFCPDLNDAGVKFEYSEKATKFEKIFHLQFDVTE